ncbi:MAG: hypothetical protein KJ795_10475 [Gammaproteobacteria bacterium]|nr:hypothetical protein [Gammaproteobacteria bacterium]MBU1776617.1 hypothetical protein [Gammaproteobacteria bacterium]MBU1968197.1 hypothetical protein [Gammaproteobacteria bacterium]
MTAQTQALSSQERRRPPPTHPPKELGWKVYLIAITLLMLAGYLLSLAEVYTAGDDVGYNLGLIGGLMMLTLLLYPLRKRFRFMSNWGFLPLWFKWHMVFGILGPALIMFHATFTIRSVNAGVALICMLLVSGSGIFGRFFYTKIHHGLYGRHSTQQQLQETLDGDGSIRSVFSFAPGIQQELNDFRERSMKAIKKGGFNLWNSAVVEIRAELLFSTLAKELHQAMYSGPQTKNWNKAQLRRLHELFNQNKEFIHSYIMGVRDIAQFSTYERLFSLWHICHLPLVYTLAFSAVWHVIAVHKY